jgi:hypothetical protein
MFSVVPPRGFEPPTHGLGIRAPREAIPRDPLRHNGSIPVRPRVVQSACGLIAD